MKAWHIQQILVKSAAGQVVAKASSREQAARYAQQWDDVVGARASAEVYAKVMRRLERAHGVAKAKAAGSRKQCPSCNKTSKSMSSDPGTHRFCTKCGESLAKSGVAKSAGPGFEALTLDEKRRLLRVVEKATGSSDPDRRLAGVGELVGALGPEVAVKVLENAPLSPAEFTRAFLTNGRAPLSARPGQTPRIPESRPISSDDFTRPALTAGHQRPNPLDRLMDPGQVSAYRSGAGIPESNPYTGATNSSTVWPALAAARSVFGNAPMPGDARG